MSSSPQSSPSHSSDAEPDDADAPDPAVAARFLKGGAIVFAVLGYGIAAWMADKWIRYPGMQATQFDFSAPLWPAATVCILVVVTAAIALLWRAAQRAESGEDLFAQRHRRGIEEAGRSDSNAS